MNLQFSKITTNLHLYNVSPATNRQPPLTEGPDQDSQPVQWGLTNTPAGVIAWSVFVFEFMHFMFVSLCNVCVFSQPHSEWEIAKASANHFTCSVLSLSLYIFLCVIVYLHLSIFVFYVLPSVSSTIRGLDLPTDWLALSNDILQGLEFFIGLTNLFWFFLSILETCATITDVIGCLYLCACIELRLQQNTYFSELSYASGIHNGPRDRYHICPDRQKHDGCHHYQLIRSLETGCG